MFVSTFGQLGVPLHYITSKVSFNVSTRYCSFWKSKRSNNKLTRTNTPRNTLHSNIKISQVVLQKVAAIWKLFVCIYEFSPPVVTTERCGENNCRGLNRFSWVRCRQVFHFWFRFMIQDCQLVVKLVSHNHVFLHAFQAYRLYFLCSPTHTHTPM